MTVKPLFMLPCLLLLALPSSANPEGLGRLFTTPQQRAQLDRQRLQNPGLITGAPSGDVNQTFNGEIRRSGGGATRWINGEMNDSTAAPRVAVGDTFNPATGELETLLRGGRIVIQPGGK